MAGLPDLREEPARLALVAREIARADLARHGGAHLSGEALHAHQAARTQELETLVRAEGDAAGWAAQDSVAFAEALTSAWRRGLADEVERRNAIQQSTSHLRQLATILSELAVTGRWPPFGGKRFLLSLVANGVLYYESTLARALLFSPGDESRDPEHVPLARWQEVTTDALRAGKDFGDLTSYCGRRNDERAYQITPEVQSQVGPILADLHSPDVAIVAFSDGTARVMTREELGLEPDDPLVAGEASRSPILRALSSE